VRAAAGTVRRPPAGSTTACEAVPPPGADHQTGGRDAMILIYTDFGWSGPYVGQMKAVLAAGAPGVPLVDLMHDAPAFAPGPAGRLLAALLRDLPDPERRPAAADPAGAGPVTAGPRDGPRDGPGPDVVLGVVDPGVGTARRPIAVGAGGRVFVGPDNGLFWPAVAAAGGAAAAEAWILTLRPARLSASFHGRDLFAPAAAAIAAGRPVPGEPIDPAGLARPDAAAAGEAGPVRPTVLYVDGYGNAMLDLAIADLPKDAVLAVGGHRLARARTFGEVPEGAAFWYGNSLGLAEIAVNRGSAAEVLGLEAGTAVRIVHGER